MKASRLLWSVGLGLMVAAAAFGQEPVPPPATAADVSAGTDRVKYVTPKALADAGWTPGGSGGGPASNVVGMDFELDTWYTNSTDYWVQPIGVVELQGDPTIVEFQVRTNLADLTEDYMRRFAVVAGSVTAVQDGLVAPGHAWRWFLASGNATMNETAPNGNELIYWGSGGGGSGSSGLDSAAVATVVNNAVGSGTNVFVGDGQGLTDVKSVYSQNQSESIFWNRWESTERILELGDAEDPVGGQVHISTFARLPSGYLGMWYGTWTNDALTGPPNKGRIKFAVSTNGFDKAAFAAGKLGEALDMSTVITSTPLTYVAGPSVQVIDGVYWMTLFGGTNHTFEGETSAGFLLYSTNGTNWVEAPSSPYVPFAAKSLASNPYSYTNLNVRNVFAGSIMKHDGLWYGHYIAYINTDRGNPATSQSFANLHITVSTNPMVANSWVDTDINQFWFPNGSAVAAPDGLSKVKRLADGTWLLDSGRYTGLSRYAHPTNFTAMLPTKRVDDGGADWIYGMYEDNGPVITYENYPHNWIGLARPYREQSLNHKAQSVTTTNLVVRGTSSFLGSVSFPSGYINETGNFNSNVWRQIANNIPPWTVPSYTNQLVITNSGALSLNGTWYYDVPRMAFTNASQAGMGAFYWVGWPGESVYDLVFTNATFNDYESLVMYASAAQTSTYLDLWYDDSFTPVAGVGGYYTGTTTTGLEFLGTFTGNLSGGTNLPASGLADGTTGTGAFVRQTNSSIYSMSVTNLFLTSKTTVVAPTSNDGVFWNSNKVLYWVTTTKTNVVSDGR